MQRMFHGRAGETGRRAQELGQFLFRAAFEQRVHRGDIFLGAGGYERILIRVAEMDQMRDAVDQHGRFAAACAGQNKQRSVDRIHGLALFRVEKRVQLIEKRALLIRIDVLRRAYRRAGGIRFGHLPPSLVRLFLPRQAKLRTDSAAKSALNIIIVHFRPKSNRFFIQKMRRRARKNTARRAKGARRARRGRQRLAPDANITAFSSFCGNTAGRSRRRARRSPQPPARRQRAAVRRFFPFRRRLGGRRGRFLGGRTEREQAVYG